MLRLAVTDIREGIGSIYIWPMLGWQEIKQRYRRSTLGPFWLTISTGVLLAAMGPLYGKLLGQDVSAYFAYLAISFVVWLFIAGLLNEACTAFISAEGYIKQLKLPLTVHVMRVVWRNFLMFAHNAVIVVVVLVFFPPQLGWSLLLVPIAVLLILANGVWAGILLGMVSARFRDIPQIVGNVVQVAFFLTPIFWKPEMLGRHRWFADANPLFHFIEIVRRPLLGQTTAPLSWVAVLVVTGVGYAVMLLFFSRFRSRIAYWI